MSGSPHPSDALAALPHGPEFRFVDVLHDLHPGRSAVGGYRVRGDEAFAVNLRTEDSISLDGVHYRITVIIRDDDGA